MLMRANEIIFITLCNEPPSNATTCYSKESCTQKYLTAAPTIDLYNRFYQKQEHLNVSVSISVNWSITADDLE